MLHEYAAALSGCHARDAAWGEILASPNGLNAAASSCALTACDHDGCYLHRRGSVGLLLVKFATLTHNMKLSRETRRWLRATLGLDADDAEVTNRLPSKTGKHPSIRALVVFSEFPIIDSKAKSVDIRRYGGFATAERALLAILKTWQTRTSGRTFKLVAPATDKFPARMDFPVALEVLAGLGKHPEHQTNIHDGTICSQILVPPLNGHVLTGEQGGYALVRCTAHPRTPLIRSGISPPATMPRNCFARILVGPVLGEVTAKSMSVLVEVTAIANVILTMRRPALGPQAASKERRLRHKATAHTPIVFHVNGLTPDCLYEYAITVAEPYESSELKGSQRLDVKQQSVETVGTLLLRPRTRGSAAADSDSDGASFNDAQVVATKSTPWGVIHDGRREGHFRTLPSRPNVYAIAVVRGALLDPNWLDETARLGLGNFFAELVCDAAMRHRPATCLDSASVSCVDLCKIYPWNHVSGKARLPHKPAALVVHFSGPWQQTNIPFTGNHSFLTYTPTPFLNEGSPPPLLQHSVCYSDEAAQSFRDEYRLAWGLPYVRDLVRAVPQIWAACPPVVAFAADQTVEVCV